MSPNLKFAAPEISEKGLASIQSDLFSVGCILFYLCAQNKSKFPFLLNQQDSTDKASHKFECQRLEKNLTGLLSGFESDLEIVLRQLLILYDPQMRGSITQTAEKSWF